MTKTEEMMKFDAYLEDLGEYNVTKIVWVDEGPTVVELAYSIFVALRAWLQDNLDRVIAKIPRRNPRLALARA